MNRSSNKRVDTTAPTKTGKDQPASSKRPIESRHADNDSVTSLLTTPASPAPNNPPRAQSPGHFETSSIPPPQPRLQTHPQPPPPKRTDTYAIVHNLDGDRPTGESETPLPGSRPVRRNTSLFRWKDPNDLDEPDEHAAIKHHIVIKSKRTASQPTKPRI